MLNLKALALLFVVSNLALTLSASTASANESPPTSINAEFSTSVRAASETTTKSDNANSNSSNAGSAHSSANSTIASVPSVPASSPTSSPSSAPQVVKGKIVEPGPSSTRAPAGGLLAEVGLAIGAAAKAATESSSPGNKSHSDATDELSLTKSTIASQEHDANEPLHKFSIYMKPICDSIDHILPKQMTRIQSQFKQFVQLTNRRLSSCFLEQYFFDPVAMPVTKTDLSAICSSKAANSNTTTNYRDFKSCAVKNWDPQVDKELDKIAAARLTKMHHHAPGDSNAAIGLSDNDDEFNLLNDVVNKSLLAEKSANSSSNETKPQQQQKPQPQQQQQHSDSSEGLMSKIHSVFTGSSNSSASKPSGEEQMSTKTPFLAVKSTSQAPSRPFGSLIDKLLGGGSTESSAKLSSPPSSLSTGKPQTSQLSSSTEPKPAPISGGESSVEPSLSISNPGKSPAKTSKAPIAETTTTEVTTVSPTKWADKSTTSAAAVAMSNPKPSIKPLETFEQILKKQEKEKQELEDKLRAERERVLKQLQKKQDEMDAKNAIIALQMQRQSSSAASDQRLHELEHQRQMAIDPIGHTIKHQQYELSRQQKASGK